MLYIHKSFKTSNGNISVIVRTQKEFKSNSGIGFQVNGVDFSAPTGASSCEFGVVHPKQGNTRLAFTPQSEALFPEGAKVQGLELDYSSPIVDQNGEVQSNFYNVKKKKID